MHEWGRQDIRHKGRKLLGRQARESRIKEREDIRLEEAEHEAETTQEHTEVSDTSGDDEDDEYMEHDL